MPDSDSNSHRRAHYLPPPTVVPLRYCSHNEDGTPIDEASCLLSLLSPSPEAKKNKEHYVLATADPPVIKESNSSNNAQQKRKRDNVVPEQPRYFLRRDARSIPGVPIIYVKRSVMVLEPMSGATENVREGFERGKLKTGVTSVTTGKRKRDEEEAAPKTAKTAGVKKVKGPNPLSVKKAKSRRDLESEGSKSGLRASDAASAPSKENTGEMQSDSGEQQTKTKRKRRHKSHRTGDEPSEVEASKPAES
jgi:U3 small nucleolar RNA-associated protein 23